MKKSESFGVNAILNILKTVSSIVFPMITFPYVSRALGAEGYGKYSFSNSVVSYFVLAAMLGVNTYGIREGARIRDDRERLQSFADDITFINFISVIISYIALLCGILFVPKLFGYRRYIFVLSIIIMFTFLGREWINTVFEDFLYITLRYIVIQLIGLICIFSFVHTSDDCLAYAVIIAFTTSAGHVINFFHTSKYVAFRINRFSSAKKHLAPILILFCGQLATTIYIQSDITVIGFLCDDTDVGVYSFASKIYLLTKSVINAVTTVAIPKIIFCLGKKDYENYKRFSSQLFEVLFCFGVPTVVGMLSLSKEILMVLGGEEYVTGHDSLFVLSIALIFAIYSGFYVNAVLIPKRKEVGFLIITVVAALVNLIANLLLIPHLRILGASITTLVSECLVMSMCLYLSRKDMKLTVNFRNIITVICGSCVVAALCFVVKSIDIPVLHIIVIALPASAVSYFIALYILKNSIAVGLVRKLHNIIHTIKKH